VAVKGSHSLLVAQSTPISVLFGLKFRCAEV